MPNSKFLSGLVLLGAGGAAGALAFRAAAAHKAQAEAAARAASTYQEEVKRLTAEQEAIQIKATEAATLKPLNAALEDHVDGATLLDLWDSEDWWRAYREEFAGARLVVGDNVLATRGKVALAANDGEVVRAARRQRVASTRVMIGSQPYVLAAARLPALPDHEPVLVLARATTVASLPSAPTAAGGQASPLEGPLPWAAAGVLGLIGLALTISGLGRRDGGGDARGVVAGTLPKEPTLKFGTAPKPRPGQVATGAGEARPPVSNGGAVSIPGATPPIPREAMGPPAPPMTVAVPTPPPNTFGRYRLLERLGEGGMSEIFTAEAQGVEGFSRTFVLKRLRPELARDKEAVAQFIDEARMQASLVHSNIVPVFDFGTVSGEYFLTQEYIAGRDLSRLMARYYEQTGQLGLDPRLAFYIAHETLQALAYAHARRDKAGNPLGIVHRDVSAGNVIISLQGEVKLSDFGIVKSNRRVTKTQVGMVKGNANFMSPEQARGMHVDGRSDLFSLGQVLYFCLTNELLYSGDNDLDVLYKAATGPTLEDYRRMHELPDPAGMILEKALAFDPRERFQSATEFAGVLAAHVGGGKAEAAHMMQVLFGEEFKHEAA